MSPQRMTVNDVSPPSPSIYKACFAAYTESLQRMRNGQPYIAHSMLMRAQQQLQGKVAESKSASMLLVMVGVRLAECSLRMHNPTDALDMANQLLASTSGAEYSTARHILHVVKALSSLELGLAFNAVIDAHNLIATAPEYRRQSSISFARHVAFKVVEHNTVQPEGCSTESCCSNARKRTRPAVSEATGTTCSHDDVQDTAATIKHTTKRCRAL